MECGGKRSATPLWLRVALLLHQRITAVRESGVALRLPPHSTSVVPGHPGDFVSRPARTKPGLPILLAFGSKSRLPVNDSLNL
jgi:hypothetical protein